MRQETPDKLCALIQKLENDIKSARQQLTVSALTKQGIDDEMSDLVRSQTEIQCIIEDLQAAEERGLERREELQAELEGIERRITGLEAELMEVLPDYQDKAREEKEEKRRYKLDLRVVTKGYSPRFMYHTPDWMKPKLDSEPFQQNKVVSHCIKRRLTETNTSRAKSAA